MKRMQGNDKGGEEKSGVSLYVNFLISFSYFKLEISCIPHEYL